MEPKKQIAESPPTADSLETTPKHEKEKLVESEKHLKILFERAADSIYLADANGQFLQVNEQACKSTGYTPEELLGMNIIDIDAEITTPQALREYFATLSPDQSVMLESVHRREDGSTFPVEITISCFETSSGNNIIGIVRDITERRRLEQNYQILFREMLNGFALHEIICDKQGKPIDYRYIDVNPAFERMTGLAAQDIIGKTVLEVLPGLESRWIENYGKVALTGEPVFLEDYTKELDKYFEVMAYRPAPNQFACIVADVTERIKAQQQREYLIKALEFKNKELQDFVCTVSHDLRSPLVNITGFSGELVRDCDSLLKLNALQGDKENNKAKIERLLKYNIPDSINYIVCSTKKMTNLLDGLLQVSRIGSIEIVSKSLDMNSVIGDVVDLMKHQLNEANINIQVGHLPGCVGDHNMVDRLFTNIISNAVKYLDPARQGSVSISGDIEGQMSVYCIEDNGIGIKQEHQAMIFEIFHRLSPDGSVEGEGLGLTIVLRILDRLGGRVWVESEPGKGSKFFVALPCSA